MGAAEDLMQRLAVSKKIMERSEQIKTGGSDNRNINMPMVEEFSPVNAKYNLPSEFLPEQVQRQNNFDPTQPLEESRILNSKLPDEIKRLMIEQPIVQPNSMSGGIEISEEVIQGAQRLMNMNSKQPTNIQEKIQSVETKQSHSTSNINVNEIKSMIRDVVRDTVRDVVREELKGAGMLAESTQDTNEVIQFKVGQHLFIGKVTKIKKLEK